MGNRCGCAGQCGCRFQEGRGVSMSGSGTPTDPVVIEVRGGESFIRGASTATVQVSVTGAGTVAEPYEVTMTRYAGDAGAPTFIFTTPGSYILERPTYGTFAMVYAAGGGGGGGAGSAYTGDGNQRYGVGGRGGGLVSADLLITDLAASIPIVVAAGGGGGLVGSSGGPGGTTTFGTTFGSIAAQGGAGGASVPQAEHHDDPDLRVPAAPGQGGAGGLYRVIEGVIPPGLPGGAGYPGQTPSGGAGGFYSSGPGGNGLPGPMRSRYRGTGGGGGGGNSYQGGPGGVGGPGAGGGGGGAGEGLGGVGGPGYVVVVIQ